MKKNELRGSQAQQCASFSPLTPSMHSIFTVQPPLFLEERVWLPLHSCHAVSVGGLRGGDIFLSMEFVQGWQQD